MLLWTWRCYCARCPWCPSRPGAWAQLNSSSFDDRLGVLRIGKDKAGKDRKIKLLANIASAFAAAAKDKAPDAALFTRADGRRWDKDAWNWPVKEAAKAAELPSNVVLYALRHAAITDLVSGGLDVLTVARLAGTSVAMIERHDGHLREDLASRALEKLAL